jgi:hypothetical protein
MVLDMVYISPGPGDLRLPFWVPGTTEAIPRPDNILVQKDAGDDD